MASPRRRQLLVVRLLLREGTFWTARFTAGPGSTLQACHLVVLTVCLVLSIGGGLKWGCSMFDVLSARDWGQVVEALVSNTQDKTDEVVLLFERPLEEAPELK